MDPPAGSAHPFKRYDSITPYEIFKYCTFGAVLAAVRLLLMLPLLIVVIAYIRLLALVGGCSVSDVALRFPHFQVFGRLAARVMLFIMGFLRVHVSGPPLPRDISGLVVCNHVSLVDILALWTILPRVPSFVAKEAITRWPAVSALMLASRGVAVDRSKRDGSARALVAARARAGPEELPLVIFPEGTTSNGTAIMPFKEGAFVAGEPLTIVTFKYPFKHFSPAYDVLPDVQYLLRLLAQVYNSVEVTVVGKYKPNTEEKKDASLFAHGVRNVVSRSLKLPTVSFTWEDKKKYMEDFYHLKYT